MKHRIEVALDIVVAREQINEAFARQTLRLSRYRPELEWLDERRARFTFLVRGMRVHGELALDPDGIDLRAEAPLPLRVFGGLAARIAEAEIRRVLADAERAPEVTRI